MPINGRARWEHGGRSGRPPPRGRWPPKGFAALALLLAWPILAAPAAPRPILVATDLDTGRVLLCRPLAADGFTLAFDHSMYGGEVRERFVPVTGRATLRRVETTTANAAAAEYYAYTAPVVRDGARFRVDVPPLELPELVVRVDRVGQHRLLIGNERLDLLPLVGDGGPLRLAIAAGGAAGSAATGRPSCRDAPAGSPVAAGEAT